MTATTDPAELRRRLRDDLGVRPRYRSPSRCDACGTHYAVAAGRCPDHTLDDQEVATMPESTPSVRTGTMNIVTGETKMDDGKPPASPLTTDGRQASVVAIEAAAKLRGAPSGKPDPKPATAKPAGKRTVRKTGKTTTTVKPATTKEADKKTTATPRPTAQPNAVGRAKTPEQRAATQAKNQATRIKTTVAAAIKAGTVDRNAITTDVAKDGNVARVAKDNGLSVDDVLAKIKPGSAKTKNRSAKSADRSVDLCVAYINGTGSPAERFAATGANAAARRALWQLGLRPGFDKQPDPKLRDALRARVAEKVGKTWAAIEKSTPVPNRKAATT